MIDHEPRQPFSFDLASEQANIQNYGFGYLPIFLENAYYYAGETYGRIPITEYYHDINGQGQIGFYRGGVFQRARDVYQKVAEDVSLPDWYRERAWRDVRWTEGVESSLPDLEQGKVAFDLSPRPYSISLEEAKKWGCGTQGFARFHEVGEIGGRKKLISQGIRNYLPQEDQLELFGHLTGEETNLDDILGRVELLKEGVTPKTAYQEIAELSKKAVEEGRAEISEGDVFHREAWQVREHFNSLEWWARRVFFRMTNPLASKADITRLFQGWEMAMKDLIEGRTLQIDREDLVTDYLRKAYRPGRNSCGFGAGFGFEVGQFLMNDALLAGLYQDTFKKKDYSCHKCGACGEVIDTVVYPGQVCPGKAVDENGEKKCKAVRVCA